MGSYQKIRDIEALIRQHPLVESCIVVGDDETYFSALISPCKINLAEILEEESPGELHKLHSYQWLNRIEVRCHYCDLLEQANTQLQGKRIERFVLLELDGGKPREQLCEEHKVIIESFYQDYIAGVG